MTSRNITVNSAASVLSFRNNYSTEYDPPPAEVFWDGFVLDVSTDGGTTWDITDHSGGGTFVSGPLYRGVHRDGEQPAGRETGVVRGLRQATSTR